MKVQVVTVDGMEEVFPNVIVHAGELSVIEKLESDSPTIVIEDSKHTVWFPKQQIIRVRISGA